MKYFSTFSGIGGFELGIKQAYVDVSTQARRKQRRLDMARSNATDNDQPMVTQQPDCVGFSEIDKYAIQVYQKQFPTHKNYGDITKINPADLPDFDCLVGGFPCQSFSIAGKRGGFNDTRGTMFFELARIIKKKRPRFFAFENVKGLLSHDQGNTFSTIINTIDELGYDCQWQVLNSKNHGVPHNRERVFIIGHLRGTTRPEVFPFGQENIVKTEVQETTKSEIEVEVPEATKQGYAVATIGDSINLSLLNSKTRRGRVGRGVSQTLDTGMQQYTIDPGSKKIRRLTPIECERLQGFPDGWTKIGVGNIEMSDTQRYKMIGNAVTVNVIKDIFSRILPCA